MPLPAKPLLQIVQNPVINILELKYFSPLNQEIQLQIFDNTGNIVLSRQLNVLKGDNLLRVEESSCLNSGIYIVSVMDKTLNRYHVKLIKK
ncbi:MAG: T9SS type A sorting domain-containing protein [Bacteroidetes bacterium]|nr:T9SS type A sorting domain-containing protein [Bacteroidota bacterium]MBS1758183.1 T9SS type A sorting domain-containing protein [Bacteroidota bacterium]